MDAPRHLSAPADAPSTRGGTAMGVGGEGRVRGALLAGLRTTVRSGARIGVRSVVGAGLGLASLLTGPAAAPGLPAPASLPPVELPGYRNEHPRLPAPSRHELARLAAENPGFLKSRARRAARDLHAAVLAAYADPEQDLAGLAARLASEPFGFRGNTVADIAVGYDWLHPRLGPEARSAVQDHLLTGCREVVEVIREQALSPYNVFLYNRPLTSLLACALALHPDRPEAAALLAFAHDVWKQRVVPVWRQIMGTSGGWHEGGEYVAIGIGASVHTLPAMWLAATGEDVFEEVPGIRGFLDFLLYRIRPDGTHFRWGDAGYFQRDTPDRIPLALRYRHRAAYSTPACPRWLRPSGYPWGPLPDPSLCDPGAIRELPLARRFDGLGLVVARSGWGADATFVTFKAGDNYWSHSHLDQGGFTIFKGGALAIDSGLYGPRYGSDHHMNYAYQAIAHNVVTVTDPADRVPGPGPDGGRPIANDGGQRRVGSGWGTGPAPLDLAAWEAERETFHTGRLLAYRDDDGVVAAVADVTAAYTNRSSGTGTFADRTRRVESLHRTFVYDRRIDAVVIRDRITVSDPAFPVRWLLHTIGQPRLDVRRRRFAVATPTHTHRRGGLDGWVASPADVRLEAVGGPGRAFLVDGRNYDEGVAAATRDNAEPGGWRIELTAPTGGREHEFLVILAPRLAGEAPLRARTRDGGRGLEIEGNGARLHLRFDAADRLPGIERGAAPQRVP